MIDKFFKKEKPITGMSGFGGGTITSLMAALTVPLVGANPPVASDTPLPGLD